MSRKISSRVNHRVVITPRRLGDFGMARISESFCYKYEQDRHKKYLDICESIKLEVKRHVDNVSDVSVEFDNEYVCEFCGSKWTEESKKYNMGCCERDQAAHEANTGE